jgi:hypothetical protein
MTPFGAHTVQVLVSLWLSFHLFISCSSSLAPNAAFLINKNGLVVASQQWFDPKAMDKEILKLLNR